MSNNENPSSAPTITPVAARHAELIRPSQLWDFPSESLAGEDAVVAPPEMMTHESAEARFLLDNILQQGPKRKRELSYSKDCIGFETLRDELQSQGTIKVVEQLPMSHEKMDTDLPYIDFLPFVLRKLKAHNHALHSLLDEDLKKAKHLAATSLGSKEAQEQIDIRRVEHIGRLEAKVYLQSRVLDVITELGVLQDALRTLCRSREAILAKDMSCEQFNTLKSMSRTLKEASTVVSDIFTQRRTKELNAAQQMTLPTTPLIEASPYSPQCSELKSLESGLERFQTIVEECMNQKIEASLDSRSAHR